MILNEYQQRALLLWLGNNGIKHTYSEIVANFHNFANGEIREWRIIHQFGMAGKLWNNNDKIYVSGWSSCEVSKKEYEETNRVVDKMNEELADLVKKWSN